MTATDLGLLTATERARIVERAVHSGEMERCTVSETTRADAEDFVAGRITSEMLVERVRDRYGAV